MPHLSAKTSLLMLMLKGSNLAGLHHCTYKITIYVHHMFCNYKYLHFSLYQLVGLAFVDLVHLVINWGEPEQAPHWRWSVMVSYVVCTDCENDEIRLRSHPSLMISYVMCTDCENNKLQLRSHSSLSWFRTSYVRTVRTIKYD